MPEQMKEVAAVLRTLFDSYVQQLVKMGCMTSKRPATTMYLLEVNKTLQIRLHSGKNRVYVPSVERASDGREGRARHRAGGNARLGRTEQLYGKAEEGGRLQKSSKASTAIVSRPSSSRRRLCCKT